MPKFSLDDFDYHLPQELIAQKPAEKRTRSRLMVIQRSTGKISHHRFSEIKTFVNPGDIFTANNARVIQGRFFGRRKTGAEIEFLMLEDFTGAPFRALLGNASRVKEGEEIVDCIEPGATLRLKKKLSGGEWIVEPGEGFTREKILAGARMPLPPYVKRTGSDPEGVHAEDIKRYQTVYACAPVAAAAPTAGLHFDKKLISEIKNQGADFTFLTLAVGVGTFRPVKAKTIEEHRMHSERFWIPDETLAKIKNRSGRLIAVGTTVVRALEAYTRFGISEGETDIFIHPPDTVNAVDALVTNFHLPKSTLLMLVASFAGLDLVKKAYQEAIKEKYRFYSYGDAMLIT